MRQLKEQLGVTEKQLTKVYQQFCPGGKFKELSLTFDDFCHAITQHITFLSDEDACRHISTFIKGEDTVSGWRIVKWSTLAGLIFLTITGIPRESQPTQGFAFAMYGAMVCFLGCTVSSCKYSQVKKSRKAGQNMIENALMSCNPSVASEENESVASAPKPHQS